MAVTRTGRSSTPNAATQLFGSDTVDRTVFIYVHGTAEVRLGFTAGDVVTTTSGFLIPPGGKEFKLQAGDEVWATGQSSQDPSFLYWIVTAV